jgi:hypothetical protein
MRRKSQVELMQDRHLQAAAVLAGQASIRATGVPGVPSDIAPATPIDPDGELIAALAEHAVASVNHRLRRERIINAAVSAARNALALASDQHEFDDEITSLVICKLG